MAGLQRSAISFRRQGSSGSVWDDKFLSELEFTAQQEEKKRKQQQEVEEEEEEEEGKLKQGLPAETESDKQERSGDDQQLQRSKSDGGGRTPAKAYRTVKVEEVEEPPSPKVAACGFCLFGKSPTKKGTKS